MDEDKYTVQKPKKYESFPDDAHEKLLKKRPPIKFRWDWGAVPPSKKDEYYHFPVPTVIFTYTGGEECYNPDDCERIMKETQKRDMNERGLTDIQYSFYIGNDGNIYEGTGFVVKNTKDPEFIRWKDTSFDIAFMGDYSNKEPLTGPLKLGKKLVKFMNDHRILPDDYEIVPLSSSRKLKGVVTENDSQNL